MNAGPSTPWLMVLAGIVIMLAALGLLLWALIGDRAKGRQRCPKCWYDLSGTESMRCSECGHEVRRERAMYRTRRRWRWAVAAVIVLLVVPAYFAHRANRYGWIKVAPTTVLLLMLEQSDEPYPMYRELKQRAAKSGDNGSAFWNWQMTMLRDGLLHLQATEDTNNLFIDVDYTLVGLPPQTPVVDSLLARMDRPGADRGATLELIMMRAQNGEHVTAKQLDRLVRTLPSFTELGPHSDFHRIVSTRPSIDTHTMPYLLDRYALLQQEMEINKKSRWQSVEGNEASAILGAIGLGASSSPDALALLRQEAINGDDPFRTRGLGELLMLEPERTLEMILTGDHVRSDMDVWFIFVPAFESVEDREAVGRWLDTLLASDNREIRVATIRAIQYNNNRRREFTDALERMSREHDDQQTRSEATAALEYIAEQAKRNSER